jgi:hypothetical protein
VAAAAENSCRGACAGAGLALDLVLGKSTAPTDTIAGYVLRTRRFELCLAYGVGAPAGLVCSFFFPPLPAFTSTSVADIV